MAYLSILIVTVGLLAVAFLAVVVYVALQPPCTDGMWPIPPPVLLEFGSHYLSTDQGRIDIGQTYHHRNEGPWVGTFTVVAINRAGAILLFRYPQGAGEDFRVGQCRGFAPRLADTSPDM